MSTPGWWTGPCKKRLTSNTRVYNLGFLSYQSQFTSSGGSYFKTVHHRAGAKPVPPPKMTLPHLKDNETIKGTFPHSLMCKHSL